MGRRGLMVGAAVASILVACAKNPPEPQADVVDDSPLVSAERLGDADAPEPSADGEPLAEDERYLSPAEHEAMAEQGYDLEIDDRTVTQTRVQPAKSDEPKGPWGRAMDHMGKGFIAVASVAMVVGMAIAPFFLF